MQWNGIIKKKKKKKEKKEKKKERTEAVARGVL